MRTLFAALLLSSISFADSSTYHCELKARDSVMHPFDVSQKDFNGDRPVELRARDFILKVSEVPVNGERRLALWLGTSDKDQSAVTLGRPADKSVYLNILLGELFAVGECTLAH